MRAMTWTAGTGRIALPAMMVGLSLVVAPHRAAAVTADTPAAVVTAVLKLDNGRDWAPVFDVKPTPLMRRYFTSAFNASWANAMKHVKEEPVLDGDPIAGQNVTSMKLTSVGVGPITGSKTTVVAHLAVRTEGQKAVPQTAAFTLLQEDGAWKIDDISGPVDGTLRNYFRKSYGK